MAKKDINIMNSIETEIKAVAKAVGASLKRQGHAVPHSAVLHAVAASLNRRDWHKLKNAIGAVESAPEAASTHANELFRDVWKNLSDDDKFWSAYVGVRGGQFSHHADGWTCSLPAQNESQPVITGPWERLQAAAKHALSKRSDGREIGVRFQLGGHEIDALVYHTSTAPRLSNFSYEPGAITVRYPVTVRAQVTSEGWRSADVEVYGKDADTWYLTTRGASELWTHFVQNTDFRQLLGFSQAKTTPAVTAEFWTDDRLYTARFDAREALEQQSDGELKEILWMGLSDNERIDDIVRAMEDVVPEIGVGLDYVRLVRSGSGRQNKDMGFGGRLNELEFFRWMDTNRRAVLANWFCENQGVNILWDGNAWAWELEFPLEDVPSGKTGFESEGEAQLDAYDIISRQCGLLDKGR
jgi:hypothetical protein